MDDRMKMSVFDALLTHLDMQIPAFWGRQVKSQLSQSAGELLTEQAASVEPGASLCSPSPWSRGAGGSGCQDGLWEQHMEQWVHPAPPSPELGSWGGTWP